MLSLLLACLTAPRFEVFDNMAYRGKPDTLPGLEQIDIVYDGWIWPGKTKGASGRKSPDYGKLPDEAFFKRMLAQHCRRTGPVVLDIEYLGLTGSADVAERNEAVLDTLVRWTHTALPGRPVGYYGVLPSRKVRPANELEERLAADVDAFFPSMYTFDDDRRAWRDRCASYVDRSHALGPGKPVYVYLWPQYHDNTPKDEQFIPADYWRFELGTARSCGADGAVIWSSNHNIKTRQPLDWDPSAPWWTELRAFLNSP